MIRTSLRHLSLSNFDPSCCFTIRLIHDNHHSLMEFTSLDPYTVLVIAFRPRFRSVSFSHVPPPGCTLDFFGVERGSQALKRMLTQGTNSSNNSSATIEARPLDSKPLNPVRGRREGRSTAPPGGQKNASSAGSANAFQRSSRGHTRTLSCPRFHCLTIARPKASTETKITANPRTATRSGKAHRTDGSHFLIKRKCPQS
jgi:hypothetical protein